MNKPTDSENLNQVLTNEECMKILMEIITRQNHANIILNPAFVKFLGYNCAAFLHLLIETFAWMSSKNKLKGDFFPLSIDLATKQTFLSRKEQDTCVRDLRSHGVIESKILGLPPNRNFRLDLNSIIRILQNFENEQVKV
jgi:hypothetical protein